MAADETITVTLQVKVTVSREAWENQEGRTPFTERNVVGYLAEEYESEAKNGVADKVTVTPR